MQFAFGEEQMLAHLHYEDLDEYGIQFYRDWAQALEDQSVGICPLASIGKAKEAYQAIQAIRAY